MVGNLVYLAGWPTAMPTIGQIMQEANGHEGVAVLDDAAEAPPHMELSPTTTNESRVATEGQQPASRKNKSQSCAWPYTIRACCDFYL
jgi:hypothetical protein